MQADGVPGPFGLVLRDKAEQLELVRPGACVFCIFKCFKSKRV